MELPYLKRKYDIGGECDEDIPRDNAATYPLIAYTKHKVQKQICDRARNIALELSRIKSYTDLVHKDYDFFDLPKQLSPFDPDKCRWYCSPVEKCEHEEALQETSERLREKLRENACEKFREIRAISYSAADTPKLRRDRTKSEIVLLDTRSEMNAIQCISIPFNEETPAYYAISYRWGDHPKWEAQTPNYMACITSISQGNLIQLCKLYRHRIRYMWIDVICINQADKYHRKMAIKNMDNIYRRAKRIIAVPDLCYCDEYPLMEDVTKEDIEAAVIWLGGEFFRYLEEKYPSLLVIRYCPVFDKNEPGTYYGYRLDVGETGNEMEPWDEEKYFFRPHDGYAELKQQGGDYEKGHEFISRIINEWAERAWVVSERIIGVDDNKLLIHILRANTVIYWRIYPDIYWTFGDYDDIAPHFHTIFNSKSTKYIDRLFAILPHTEYKDTVQNLVDEEITIDNEQDLKLVLFNILDMDARKLLFGHLFDGEITFELIPLSVEEREDSDSDDESLPDGFYYPTIEYEKRALKLSCFVVYPYLDDSGNAVSIWDAENGSEMVLLYSYHVGGENWYRTARYSMLFQKSNGVWTQQSDGHFPLESWNGLRCGEFLILL
ncbi:hypothetical protein EC973_003115 [Apophysomyces ossiformis]|uniref:Heterokaryon incompatibility domain-containing protein n=1 Tax=Apophysomyces ossiformis TaxID=679940 RepID=A0A8H7EL99_9FUNG|nr:hypothetical protein EC973_003115 [Apophysomyces ossiformis]